VSDLSVEGSILQVTGPDDEVGLVKHDSDTDGIKLVLTVIIDSAVSPAVMAAEEGFIEIEKSGAGCE